MTGPGGEQPGGPPPGPRPSGLRNPAGTVRAMGAATMGVEALVLLLGIQPIRVLGDGFNAAAVTAVVLLAVAAVVLAALMRHRWAWYAATGLQGLLLLAGFLHWSLFGAGLIFAAVWGYVLHVRRVILG